MFKLGLRRRCIGRDLGKLFFWIEASQCPFDRPAVAVFDLCFAQLEALTGTDAFGLDLGGHNRRNVHHSSVHQRKHHPIAVAALHHDALRGLKCHPDGYIGLKT
jgi:hypothetical protein